MFLSVFWCFFPAILQKCGSRPLKICRLEVRNKSDDAGTARVVFVFCLVCVFIFGEVFQFYFCCGLPAYSAVHRASVSEEGVLPGFS